MEERPALGASCVDLGASPGGWTSALRRLGCIVTAVDRAPLAPQLMADDGVTFIQGDAFSYRPDQPVCFRWPWNTLAASFVPAHLRAHLPAECAHAPPPCPGRVDGLRHHRVSGARHTAG